MGAQQLGVDEINFFRDDNTVLHFVRPEAYASIQNNTFIVSGEPETKTIKDLLPDIIQQLGPKQHKLLQELVQQIGSQSNEEVPNLVESDLNKV
jgi:nascent polypeptide-associated complex subunit beta